MSDWFRSAMPLLLLSHLAQRATHGYDLMEHLRQDGFEVRGATVYPHLNRLQEDGFVEARWQAPDSGPARKVLTITPSGLTRLATLRSHWVEFRDQLDAAQARHDQEKSSR